MSSDYSSVVERTPRNVVAMGSNTPDGWAFSSLFILSRVYLIQIPPEDSAQLISLQRLMLNKLNVHKKNSGLNRHHGAPDGQYPLASHQQHCLNLY